MVRKTIHLDRAVRQKIVDLLKVHDLLLQHRNSRLGRVSAVFHGLAVGSGFVLVMGVIKAGWFELAPLLAWLLISSWLVAEFVSKVLKAQPLKINIRP